MTLTEYYSIYESRKQQYDELKKIYCPEGSSLRIYQNHLTKVIVAFNEFCKQNGIKYYIAYGTLLGAIRHKDFVPWDDDIDLWMTRENYLKLESLMHGKYHQLTDFLSVSMGIRPELWAPPAAYIDIFILDRSPKNKFLRALKNLRVKFLYIMLKSRQKINFTSLKHPKPYLLFSPIAIFGTVKFWNKRFIKAQTWLTSEKYCKHSPCLQSYCATFKGISQKLPYMQPEGLGDTIDVEFNGYILPAPKNFEIILKQIYGDFMSIPQKKHDHGLANSFEKITKNQ